MIWLELVGVLVAAAVGASMGVIGIVVVAWRAARKSAAVQTLSQLGAEQKAAEQKAAPKPKTLRLVTDEGSAS